MRWGTTFRAIAALCAAAVLPPLYAQDKSLAPRQAPAKTLPVPTDVSPEMQKLIAAPLRQDWDAQWKTGEDWRKVADAAAAKSILTLPGVPGDF